MLLCFWKKLVVAVKREEQVIILFILLFRVSLPSFTVLHTM